jgi:hypothetical protein
MKYLTELEVFYGVRIEDEYGVHTINNGCDRYFEEQVKDISGLG